MKQKNKQVSLIIKTKRCLNTNKREQSDNNNKKNKIKNKRGYNYRHGFDFNNFREYMQILIN